MQQFKDSLIGSLSLPSEVAGSFVAAGPLGLPVLGGLCGGGSVITGLSVPAVDEALINASHVDGLLILHLLHKSVGCTLKNLFLL